MDASEAVYYPFLPTHDPPASTSNSKQCSVRGCPRPVADDSTNKMCDVCRSRHRIYASTKRARRKLEKAVVANVAARDNLNSAVVDWGQSHKADSMPTVIGASWSSENSKSSEQESSATNPNQQQTNTAVSYPTSTSPSTNWNSIDPRLFAPKFASSSTQHVHLQQSTSSSELANALTLPLPRQEIPSQAVTPSQNDDDDDDDEEEGQTVEENFPVLNETEPTDPSGASTRFCSVKGCKAVVPASYKFKMCPPCRTRYRTYGITKRAKWKSERASFDHEMAGLRILEDKRRVEKGLPPLADNPDELRAWELSILDEQAPAVPEETSSQSLTPSMPTSPGPGPVALDQAQAPLDPTHPLNLSYISPNVIAGVYPATIGSIDPPYYSQAHLTNPFHSAVLVPLLAESANPNPSPLPGVPLALPQRMCTVSHCHKILPGEYRFKRCERHRIQNRHHSKLKRFREKAVKALGPEDGAMVLDFAVEGEGGDDGEDDDAVDDDGSGLAEISGTSKGKGKGKERATDILGTRTSDSISGVSSTNQQDPNMSSAPTARPKASGAKSREEMQKRSRYSCVNDDCHNLLTPGVRWRTCDECRNQDRLRKIAARAELKAKEKEQEQENLAREAVAALTSTSSNSMPAMYMLMSTGSQGGVYGHAIPELTLPSSENGEEDAEGDPDIDSAGEDPQTSHPQSQPFSEHQSVAQPESDTTQTQKPTWATAPADDLTNYQRHSMPPPPPHPHHLSPTFNSLNKQRQPYARARAAGGSSSNNVKGAFSKFRVELTSNLSWKTSQVPVPVYSGFLPPKTNANTKAGSSNSGQSKSVGTVSVSASKAKEGESESAVGPAEATEDVGTVTSNPQNGPPVAEATTPNLVVPANPTQQPTIAGPSTQIATVDKEPSKHLAPSIPPLPAPSQKKKAPAKGKKGSAANAASTIPANPLSALPPGFSPYGLPTSTYPYYPLFMPPFPYPTLPPTQTKNGAISLQLPGPSSSSAPGQGLPPPHLPAPAPSHYFPYPFVPQPLPPHLAQAYGMGMGMGMGIGLPPSYPYLPPRYTVPNQNSVSGQQPYPTIPPPAPKITSSKGKGKGKAAVASSVSALPSSSASASVSVSASSSTSQLKPVDSSPPTAQEGPLTSISTSSQSQAQQDHPDPSTVNAGAPAEPTFTHYHEFLSYDASLADPNRPVRKRRKVDPNYLEKYRAIHGFDPIDPTASSSSSSVSRLENPVDESLKAPMEDGADLTTESSSSVGLAKSQIDDIPRFCARKACHRIVPSDVAGTICVKCKVKFKKQQVKIRRKHKLEPQRIVIAKESGV